jgi:hypothetical protein
MFDPRWDDDPRDRDEGSRDLRRGSRGGGSDPRERDRPDPRDVFVEHVGATRANAVSSCGELIEMAAIVAWRSSRLQT